MKNFLIFGLFIVLGFVGFMAYHVGAFKPVEITTQNTGTIYLLGKNHMGPYHTTVRVIEEVEGWALSQKIDCRFSFGQYLDNPSKVESERLRSRGGCLYFNDKPEITNLPAGFEWHELKEKNFVIAKFSGSPGIGPMKVYPKVEAYLKAQNLQQGDFALEVYEILDRTKNNAMTTTYYFPIHSAQ